MAAVLYTLNHCRWHKTFTDLAFFGIIAHTLV